MAIIPKDSYCRGLLLTFLILFGLTCIDPPFPQDFMLQHTLTVGSLTSLLFLHQRLQFSRLSFTLILGYLCLHLLGARYLYSFVPYDEWSKWLLGISIKETFGFERNHYDRLVHFLYGVMLVVPAWEVTTRHFKIQGFWACFGAVQFIVFSGTLYEILEWGIAMLLAPDWAEKYNGQQGDVWDPQRDMLLALLGAMISVTVAAFWNRRKESTVC